MLFTLIKNEFIKISKRAKTWIVFGLFALCVIGAAFLNNYSAKQMAYHNSPEGRIEQLNDQIKWANQRIEDAEKYNDKWAEEDKAQAKAEIERCKEQIKLQEDMMKNPDDPDLWKKKLEEEKKEVEERVNDTTMPERYKSHDRDRLKEINMYLENDMKPIEEWEFDAINFATGLMQMIGLIVLVAGIAVFMSDIISGESTPATLKFLLVQPISRGKVILSKFIAVVVTVVGMIVGLEVAAFGVVGAITGFDAAKMPKMIGTKFYLDYSEIEKYGTAQIVPVENSGILSTRGEALFQSLALQILFIVACCAFIFLISAIFKSSMITMALSVIISVAGTMICMMSGAVGKFAHLIFLNYGNTSAVVDGSVVYMFNNPGFSVGLGIALMVGTIVVSYVLAHIVFSKKDILV